MMSSSCARMKVRSALPPNTPIEAMTMTLKNPLPASAVSAVEQEREYQEISQTCFMRGITCDDDRQGTGYGESEARHRQRAERERPDC